MLISPNLSLLYLINGQMSEREGKLRENSDHVTPRTDCVSTFFFFLCLFHPMRSLVLGIQIVWERSTGIPNSLSQRIREPYKSLRYATLPDVLFFNKRSLCAFACGESWREKWRGKKKNNNDAKQTVKVLWYLLLKRHLIDISRD